MKSKLFALILAIYLVFAVSSAFAQTETLSTTCTDCNGTTPIVSSVDVKAYGMMEATYGQSASEITAHETGCIKTETDSLKVDLVTFGACNEVADCGQMNVGNFQLDATRSNSYRESNFCIDQKTYAMDGSAELKNMAGVAICATTGTYADGAVNNTQTFNQCQTFQRDGYSGTQNYSGTSVVSTSASTY